MSLAHLCRAQQARAARARRFASGATLLACALLAGAAFAAAAPTLAPTYMYGAASADGIGKFYDGREIAAVMGFEGATWLDRRSREQEERPDLLLNELGLVPGMAVADIGAGSGYLTRRIAPLIPGGTVYAVDVQPEMVHLLDELAHQPGMSNIAPRLGAADDVGLPPNSIDLAVMVDVYHELAFPREVMQSLIKSLRPGGRVVFVEYRAEDPNVPIKALHKMPASQVRREMRGLPLVWVRNSERLPMQHVIIFRKS